MRVAVAADVVRGFAFLHSRDVMFRDLKSSNVILNYESDHRPRFRCGIDAAAEIVQRRQLDGVARGSSTSARPTTMQHGRSPHPAVHLCRVQ
jgi:serine/threonine protein kinase